jgi:hypothetical protein
MKPGGDGAWPRRCPAAAAHGFGEEEEGKIKENKNDRVEPGTVGTFFVNLTVICKTYSATLEQIRAKLVDFCNLAQYQWFLGICD